MKKKFKLIAILILIIFLLSVIAGLVGYLISMFERTPTTFDYGLNIKTSGLISVSKNPSNTNVIMLNGTFDSNPVSK